MDRKGRADSFILFFNIVESDISIMRHNDVDVRPAERHFGMVIGPKFPAELFVRHVVGSDRRVMRDLLCQALDIASDDFESLAK